MPGVTVSLRRLLILATLPFLGACGQSTPPSQEDMQQALGNELLNHVHEMYQQALEEHNIDDVAELSELSYHVTLNHLGTCERVYSEEDIDTHWRCPVQGTFTLNDTTHEFERDVDIYQDSVDHHWKF